MKLPTPVTIMVGKDMMAPNRETQIAQVVLTAKAIHERTFFIIFLLKIKSAPTEVDAPKNANSDCRYTN